MLRDLINLGVPMKFGNQVFNVKQLTIRDMAEMDHVASLMRPSGFDAIYLDEREDDYDSKLKEITQRIREYNPRLFSGTTLGISHLVRLAIGFSSVQDAYSNVVSVATNGQIYHLINIAYGFDDLEFINDLLYGREDTTDPNMTDRIGKAVDFICQKYGWTLDYAISLTPNQVAHCLRDGNNRNQNKRQKPVQDVLNDYHNRCLRHFGSDDYGDDIELVYNA